MKTVCIFYLPYSGGKFISNCLGMSKRVLLNDPTLASKDLQTTIFGDDYYQWKLQSAIDLLMPTRSDFESTGLWKEWKQHIKSGQKDRINCCVAHFNEGLEERIRNDSVDYICKLVNFERFNSLAFFLKSETKDVQRHSNGFEEWTKTSKRADFDFDIDTIWSSTEFSNEVERLYLSIGLDDFRRSSITTLHRAYMSLHGIDL